MYKNRLHCVLIMIKSLQRNVNTPCYTVVHETHGRFNDFPPHTVPCCSYKSPQRRFLTIFTLSPLKLSAERIIHATDYKQACERVQEGAFAFICCFWKWSHGDMGMCCTDTVRKNGNYTGISRHRFQVHLND